MHESDNPLYGRTISPWHADRSPGGSSGGESAIIAAGGSALGLANDLGGSIRQPAHACGICGLKPTSGRLTNLGLRLNLVGMEAIVGQPGPMARSVDDLTLAMRVLAAPGLEHIDPTIAPVAWPEPEQVEPKPITRGDVDRRRILSDHPPRFVEPCWKRAKYCERRGVEVEAFQAARSRAGACSFIFGCSVPMAGLGSRRTMSGDNLHPEVRQLIWQARIPRVRAAGLSVVSATALGQHRKARLLRTPVRLRRPSIGKRLSTRVVTSCDSMAALDAGRFDAMLCPVHALPALTHGSFIHLLSAASPSMLTNLLGVPSGAVPVTTVRVGEESDRRVGRDQVDRAALGGRGQQRRLADRRAGCRAALARGRRSEP